MWPFLALAALAAPDPPPAEFVHLAAGARVCADPLLQGPCFYLNSDRALEQRPIVLGYRGEQGDVLALELVGEGWRRTCADGGWTFSPSGLRVYAARGDVLATVRRPVTIAEGGTGLTLDPGAPLLPAGEGRWRLHPAAESTTRPADGPLTFPLPADAIGLRFTPGASAARLDRLGEHKLNLVFGAPVEILGQRAEVGTWVLGVRRPGGAPPGVIEVDGRCAVYRIRIDPAAVLPAPEPGGAFEDMPGEAVGISGSFTAEPGDHTLPPGTALTWPGGAAAGVLIEEEIARGDPDDVRDGLRCWKVDVGYPAAPREPEPFAWGCLPVPPALPAPHPQRVILGALEVQGDAEPAALRLAIEEDLPALAYCYERALEQTPTLAGEVQIKAVISRAGDVREPVIQPPTLGSPAVEACLDDHLLGLSFPARADEAVVVLSYPLTFNPSPP